MKEAVHKSETNEVKMMKIQKVFGFQDSVPAILHISFVAVITENNGSEISR